MVRRQGQLASGTELTAESAAAAKTAAIDSIKRGTFFARKEVAALPSTLEEGIKRWAKETRPLRKTEDARTKHDQRAKRVIKYLTEIKPPLNQLPLGHVQRRHMITYRNWRRAAGLGASAIANEMFVISQVFRSALDWGLEVANPCAGNDAQGMPIIPAARAERRGRELRNARPITGDEMESLLRVASRYRHMPAIIRVAAMTGLRLGQIELLGPEWLRRDKSGSPELLLPDLGGVGARRSKNFHGQVVPISARAAEFIESLSVCGDGRFFDLAHHAASMLMTKIKKKAGVNGVSLHSARHTHNAALELAGATPADRAAALGQSSVDVNVAFYTHADAGRLRKALDDQKNTK